MKVDLSKKNQEIASLFNVNYQIKIVIVKK